MSKRKKTDNSTVATVAAAAEFNRRTMFKMAAGAAAFAAAGPAYVKHSFGQSSGTLTLLNWDDELPDPVIPEFEKKTGIKVTTVPFSQNEEQINKLQATAGAGFDLCQPTRDRSPQFQELGLLAPFDTNKLKLDALVPSMLAGSTSVWTWEGKLYHVPHCWGSEAISWRTDLTTLDYDKLSYGTLWEDQYKGKVQGRPHSILLGIGLWWDATGKIKTNRMIDTFKNEDLMKKTYDEILKFAISKKSWIKQFWDSADNTKSGLLENGVVIGQTWDGPALSLKKQGKPVSYMAPQEGAIAWLDGWALTKGAKNIAQAYEWINYVHSPEVSAKVADGSGYNPIAKGAENFLSDVAKKNFVEAYPKDAVAKLWQREPEPSWYAELRTQYAEKLKAA
jgi:spermidine/putrescine transport system substrate-binding protein